MSDTEIIICKICFRNSIPIPPPKIRIVTATGAVFKVNSAGWGRTIAPDVGRRNQCLLILANPLRTTSF